jgi:hypothetical protein
MKPWAMDLSADGHRVDVVFSGHLSAEEGALSANAFREVLSEAPRDVVWDVRAMTGYDGGARDSWAKGIWPVRGAMKSLTVIGAKGLIRIGATFLAVLLGVPYEFRDAPQADTPEAA